MNRSEFLDWLEKGQSLSVKTNQPLIMGILNATPDSFSDGGRFNSLKKSVDHAQALIASGADIIDIGGESTKPGATIVPIDEELKRVIPVIEQLRKDSDICISIDTSKVPVMKAAIDAGADCINDVNALQSLGALEMAASLDVPICLMHMKGSPKTMQHSPEYSPGIIPEIMEFFAQRIKACKNAGIKSNRLILDPGFGFGKLVQHNLQLVKHLNEFYEFGLPILLGVSRKQTLGVLLSKEVDERLIGGLALAIYGVLNGVSIIRTHDVDETRQAFTVIDAVLNADNKVGTDEST